MTDQPKLPHLLKYMGSKREILDFITEELDSLNIDSKYFCDLFAGTSIVGSSLKTKYNLHLNDIQDYSSVFAHTYSIKCTINKNFISEVKEQMENFVNEFYNRYPHLRFQYSIQMTLDNLIELEKKQQALINENFDIGFHLFTKYYSGTYWSCEQCILIDSLRAVAEYYKGRTEYYIILSALIYAMSYTSQGTGHFAQFRDMNTTNVEDIMIYRKRKLWPLFKKKFIELISNENITTKYGYKATTLDYVDCLKIIDNNSIVYADPPYSAVHYSRFYHAIETLVKYDYPQVKYKGRYREDRHQSPFCIKSEVKNAFMALFNGIKLRESHLILSYSDNGIISKDEIISIADQILGENYIKKVSSRGHTHSKMGRSDKHNMQVNELLISYKRK